MLCPADDAVMVAAAVGGHAVHRCPQCGGVAFTGTQLPEVRAQAALQLHRQSGEPALVRPCPLDSTMMRPLVYKDVGLCACTKCYGLWVEKGQVLLLLDSVKAAAAPDLGKLGRQLGEIKPPHDSRWRDWRQWYVDNFEFVSMISEVIAKVFK